MIPELNETDLEYGIIHGNVDDFGVDENPVAMIKHVPSGLKAECNYDRSWMYNRKIAYGMLCQKVHDYYAVDNSRKIDYTYESSNDQG